MTEWIDILAQLPENNEQVLVFVDSETANIGQTCGSLFDGGKRWSLDDEELDLAVGEGIARVTYWMALPPDPQRCAPPTTGGNP